MQSLINTIWDSDNPHDLHNQLHTSLFNPYNVTFMSAVQGVEAERAKLYKNNLTMLAAAKSATIVNNLIALKKQTDSKESYLKAAKQVVNTFNSYTAAEYNTMVHRVRVAKQFEQFQNEQHIYPNIEWLPTRSATPDLVHRGYWHHVWPQNHPFWQNNFPGCRWNCKCSWRTTDAPPTDTSNVKIVPPSPGLDGNPYYTNKIISHTHPYYKNVEPHIPKLGVLTNPDDVVYININNIQVHYLAMLSEEFEQNIKIAEHLARNGYSNIRLLPQIHASEVELRNRYFGREYNRQHPTTNPDAIIGNQNVEFKRANRNTFGLRLHQAAKKSSIAVIQPTESLSQAYVERIIHGAWKNATLVNITEIVILNDDKLLVFKRP